MSDDDLVFKRGEIERLTLHVVAGADFSDASWRAYNLALKGIDVEFRFNGMTISIKSKDAAS